MKVLFLASSWILVVSCLAVFGLVLAKGIFGFDFPPGAYFFTGLFFLKLVWNVFCPGLWLVLSLYSPDFKVESVRLMPEFDLLTAAFMMATVGMYQPEALMQYPFCQWLFSGSPPAVTLKYAVSVTFAIGASYVGMLLSVRLTSAIMNRNIFKKIGGRK